MEPSNEPLRATPGRLGVPEGAAMSETQENSPSAGAKPRNGRVKNKCRHGGPNNFATSRYNRKAICDDCARWEAAYGKPYTDREA